MTLNTLPDYEVNAPPAHRSPTRLYPLAPIGVGTPLVESLTSYLTRLAHAHGVTVEKLAVAEIAPLVNKSAQATQNEFSSRAHHLNSLGEWADLTLSALQKLTRRDDLPFLTWYPWRQVFAHGDFLRSHLAWCPACYTHWQQAGQTIYNPLLWTLQLGQRCPYHQQPLWERCPYPDCRRLLRAINSKVKLGYCPHCWRWLGLEAETSQTPPTPPDEECWQLWLADQLAGLLAATPTLAAYPEQQQVALNIKRCMAASAPGSVRGLAREMGLSASSFFGWIKRGHHLQLHLLARLCYHLDVSLLAMLTAQPGQADDSLPPETNNPWSTKTSVEVSALRQQLARLLADPQTSPGSASQVARQVGVNSGSIKRHCPEQHQQILQRHEQSQRTQRQIRNEKLARDLQTFLDSEEAPPPSLFKVARRLRLKPTTVRANCPELCRAISEKRSTFYQTRQLQAEAGLREILAEEEEPPLSINQAAARLGEDVNYLYRQFPALCQAVTQRYHQNRPPSPKKPPPPPLSPQPKSTLSLRPQFMALLAAETAPPPPLAEVTRRLGCSLKVLRQRCPDLCRQLRQRRDTYRQQRDVQLADRLRQILAARELPPPTLRDVAERLDVNAYSLKRLLPELYAEVARRHQAYQQAERERRRVVLEQIISTHPLPCPSLSQVAASLGCQVSTLPKQFPAESQIIVARYRAYRQQAYVTAQIALEAALQDTPQPPLLPFEVARQLGQKKAYLQKYFPELCHQLAQRYEEHRRQVARARLEAVLAEPSAAPPPTLTTVSQRLGYTVSSLTYLCPDLCQVIEERHQAYWQQKKEAVQAMLEAILKGEQTPAPLKAVAREFGYMPTTLQNYFPELASDVSAKYKAYARVRGEQRRRQLDEEIRQITRALFEAGIDPKLGRVAVRLASPRMIIARHAYQAWQAARQELGLPG